MSDIICRSWDEEKAARKQLLTDAKQRDGRCRAVNPPFYRVEVPVGEASVSVFVHCDFTIEQAKQLHRHLAEAIAEAEAYSGSTDQLGEEGFYVSCLIDSVSRT